MALASEPAVLSLSPYMELLLVSLGSGTQTGHVPLFCLASVLTYFQDQRNAYSRIRPNTKHHPGVEPDSGFVLQTRLPDHPDGSRDQLGGGEVVKIRFCSVSPEPCVPLRGPSLNSTPLPEDYTGNDILGLQHHVHVICSVNYQRAIVNKTPSKA